MTGFNKKDVIEGGIGKDTLNGGPGDDELLGGANDDTYIYTGNATNFNFGKDRITDDGPGTDTDTLDFSGFNNLGFTFKIKKSGAIEVFRSHATDPTQPADTANKVEVIRGIEILKGGMGNDLFLVERGAITTTRLQIDGGGGTDTLDFTGVLPLKLINGKDFTQDANVDLTTALQPASYSFQEIKNVELVTGGSGIDVIKGAVSTKIMGGLGTDLVIGGTEANELYGDAFREVDGKVRNVSSGLLNTNKDKADVLIGNMGDDTLVGGEGNDILIGGQATAEFKDDNMKAPADVEGPSVGTNRHIYYQVASGDMDPDRLEGGRGNDRYVFADNWGTTDTVLELTNNGIDTLDFSKVTTNVDVEVRGFLRPNPTGTIPSHGVTVTSGANTVKSHDENRLSTGKGVDYVEEIIAGQGTNTFKIELNDVLKADSTLILTDRLILDNSYSKDGTLDLSQVGVVPTNTTKPYEFTYEISRPDDAHRDAANKVVVTIKNGAKTATLIAYHIQKLIVGKGIGTFRYLDDAVITDVVGPKSATVDEPVKFDYSETQLPVRLNMTEVEKSYRATIVTEHVPGYVGTPAAGESLAYVNTSLSIGSAFLTQLEATLSTESVGGFIFDQYDAARFKFAGVSADTGEVVIGHHTAKKGYVIEASVDRGILAGEDYTLEVTLKGTTVSVSLDGQVVLGHAFNAVTVDGDFGLMSRDGTSSFDTVTVSTDDPAYLPAGGPNLLASVPPGGITTEVEALAAEALAPIVDEAIARLADALVLDASTLDLLDAVTFEVTDLSGLMLGQAIGSTVLIDIDAAGYGWFIDETPYDDTEFRAPHGDAELLAAPASEALGHIDLLTVVMHELGHVLGFEDLDTDVDADALMSQTLEASVRRLPSDTEDLSDAVAPAATPAAAAETVQGVEEPSDAQDAPLLVFDTAAGRFRAGDDDPTPPVSSHGYILDFTAFGTRAEDEPGSHAAASSGPADPGDNEPATRLGDAARQAPASTTSDQGSVIDWHSTFRVPVETGHNDATSRRGPEFPTFPSVPPARQEDDALWTDDSTADSDTAAQDAPYPVPHSATGRRGLVGALVDFWTGHTRSKKQGVTAD